MRVFVLGDVWRYAVLTTYRDEVSRVVALVGAERPRSCSQSCRSERTENSAARSFAFSSTSGGIDARPDAAYIASRNGDIEASAPSASALMLRSGWSRATSSSAFQRHNIDGWGLVAPRIAYA